MKIILTIAIAICCLTSCKKKDAVAADVTVSVVASLKDFGGNERVKLSWLLTSATGLSRCRIYWNQGADSLNLAIKPGTDTMTAIVSNLNEGAYTFAIVVMDEKGNTSKEIRVKGNVYGAQYAGSLHNRTVRSIVYHEDIGTADITFDDAGEGSPGSEMEYKDSFGISRSVFVPSYYSSISLSAMNARKDSMVFYRTVFLPEPNAIDTFYTAYDTLSIKIPETTEDDPAYTHAFLRADGPGNTYELINSVLGGSAEETPECAHAAFGRHITEEYNNELKKNVFAFYLHVTPDNDRCVNFDRQRCEIKTYGPSPDSVKAFKGDEMIFQWKFKLDAGLQPSYSFTHIHQLKAGDGPNDGSPIITITPRYGDPDKLQIIHTGDSKSTSLGTVKEVNLAPFKGVWIEATEKVKFGTNDSYELVLKSIKDGKVLFSYSNNNMDLWRTGSTFVRPKWGIYRSLNHPEQLRDEKVLFADFMIGKRR